MKYHQSIILEGKHKNLVICDIDDCEWHINYVFQPKLSIPFLSEWIQEDAYVEWLNSSMVTLNTTTLILDKYWGSYYTHWGNIVDAQTTILNIRYSHSWLQHFYRMENSVCCKLSILGFGSGYITMAWHVIRFDVWWCRTWATL